MLFLASSLVVSLTMPSPALRTSSPAVRLASPRPVAARHADVVLADSDRPSLAGEKVGVAALAAADAIASAQLDFGD